MGYIGRLYAPPILPAVYDKALSYEEQLHILNAKLDEVIEVFNSYGQEMMDEAINYTNAQIKLLQQQTNQQLEELRADVTTQFTTLENELKQKIDDVIGTALEQFKETSEQILAEFSARVNEFNERMDGLEIAINTLFDALARTKLDMRQELEAKIEEVYAYVEEMITAKTGEMIVVKNPVTQTLTTLNKALNDLFKGIYTQWALTVDEYKSLQLTAQEYHELNIGAMDYLLHGKLIFFKELYFPNLDEDFKKVYGYINEQVEALDKNHYMVSPFDGVVTPIHQVIYQLAELHMDGITVDQYRDALLTVDEYKAKQIGAHDYAWNGYFLIYTDATPKPTLQEEIREAQRTIAALAARVEVLENEAVPSETLARMQADIVQNAKNLTSFQNVQTENNRDQQRDIEANKALIDSNIDDIEHINEEVIPDAIEGVTQTFNTVTSGLQTQITSITSGLERIHINYD